MKTFDYGEIPSRRLTGFEPGRKPAKSAVTAVIASDFIFLVHELLSGVKPNSFDGCPFLNSPLAQIFELIRIKSFYANKNFRQRYYWALGRHSQQAIRISLSLLLKLSARCELISPNFVVYVVKNCRKSLDRNRHVTSG